MMKEALDIVLSWQDNSIYSLWDAMDSNYDGLYKVQAFYRSGDFHLCGVRQRATDFESTNA